MKVPDLSPLAAGVGVAVGVGDEPANGGAPDGVAVGVGFDDGDVAGVVTAVAGGAACGVRKAKRRTTPMAVAARVAAGRMGMAEGIT